MIKLVILTVVLGYPGTNERDSYQSAWKSMHDCIEAGFVAENADIPDFIGGRVVLWSCE